MIRNYLKIAWRNIRKHKLYAAINTLGLATGIACCLLILLHVQDELSFDGFHQNADNIYRVLETRDRPGQGEFVSTYTMGAAGPAMTADLPEVQDHVRLFQGWRLTIKNDEPGLIMRNYFLADHSFFNIFDFAMRDGDARTALSEPNSVVLTAPLAKKLFGNENPVGKTLKVEAEDFPEFGEPPFLVTGVLEELPHNSHLQFELLVSLNTVNRFEGWKNYLSSWSSGFVINYILTTPAATLDKLNAHIETLNQKHREPEVANARKLSVQPFRDIHFHSAHIQGEINANEGELNYVYIFAAISFFILLIACINYMNLATARSMRRAKEIGLRKVVGAEKKQLIAQFLGESILTCVVAFFLAIGLIELIQPLLPEIAGKSLSFTSQISGSLLLAMFALVVFIGLISGAYPAFYLSRFQAISIFREKVRGGFGESVFRRILVVTQFSLSIIMIAATLVVFNQLEFIQDKKLGFDQERLAVIDINHDDVQSNFLAVKTELQRVPGVQSVAVSSRVPGDWKNFRSINVTLASAAEDETTRMFFNGVDEGFLQTYKINLLQGRNFSRQLASDTAAVILNETAAKQLFTDSPIDQIIEVPSNEFVGHVIGVIEDFHFHSLHSKIEPMVLGFMPNGGRHPIHGIDYFTLRLSGTNLSETIAQIDRVHAQFDPVNPMELAYLQDWLRNSYDKDARIGSLFGLAAGLAIVIASIGLLGLAAFMAEQRTKEIGVRKVLGATVSRIMVLLSKDFALLVVIANLIAWPVAWFAMNQWLQGFAYRIDRGLSVFAASGLLALLTALLTVSVQAVRAAVANPVDALKYE